MKRFIYVLATMVISMGAANAQDLITKKNGEDVKAKVLEVTTNEVKYKLYDEPNGVTYTVKKSELLMIRYESGRNEVFNQNSISDLYFSDREPLEGLRPNMNIRNSRRCITSKNLHQRWQIDIVQLGPELLLSSYQDLVR